MFGLLKEQDIPLIVSSDGFSWLISRSLTRYQVEDEPDQTSVPVWSAYHSLLNAALPLTRDGAPPLLAHPVHEWNTILTVLMRAQDITTSGVVDERKTVISLDMELYLPAKKLQMARKDLNRLVLRPGELPIVMAMLKTIAACIESGRIDLCSQDAELYGSCTVKQLPDGKQVKRGEKANLITLQDFFRLYLEGFLKNEPHLRQSLEQLSRELSDACRESVKERIEKALQRFIDVINSSEVIMNMSGYDTI